MRFVPGGIVFLVTLALAPIAEGAPRYASPTGSGFACTAKAPCEIHYAIKTASSGDEVIVGAGTYGIGTERLEPAEEVFNVDIHGEFGGPRPVIAGAVSGYALIAGGSEIEYLEVVNSAYEARGVGCHDGGGINRVRATATGAFAAAITAGGQSQTCSIRNSVAIASGQQSVALAAGSVSKNLSSVIRNVTAIASGENSEGILASSLEGSHVVDLRNSIARGSGFDLSVKSHEGGVTNLRVSNSNFVTHEEFSSFAKFIDEGGNQTAPPLFVNAAAGDYREAAGSPTIDAGVSDQLDALDFDGNARVLGAGPDIGAYEFVPPAGPPAPLAQILALTVAPKVFKAANIGGAILSARKKAKAPVAATVSYSLSAAAAVAFSVERKAVGRKAGKKCVKPTKANNAKKKCPLYKSVKGGFTHSGATGANNFKFSGRLTKALPPGSYRLTGKTGASSRTADFRVVK
jgi:hypothetical protein